MYIPKKYGMSRIDNCPFCGKTSVTKNRQGVPVCKAHKDRSLDGLKCLCGEWLDIESGKWGPYCRCIRCGNVSFKKALEANPHVRLSQSSKSVEKKVPKETIVRSDELDFI